MDYLSFSIADEIYIYVKSILAEKLIYIFSILVILLLSTNSVLATPDSIKNNFIILSDFQNSGIDLCLDKASLNQDLTNGDFDLKLFFDGRLLLRGKQYPQNIKVEIYTIVEDKKNFLSILNRTVKSNKAAENILLTTKLPRVTESTEIYFDLYSANNILEATYKTDIKLNTSEITETDSIEDYECLAGDGECLIEYILRNLSFSASYDRNLKTEVVKNTMGRYTVSIPVKKGRTLKSKVRQIASSGGGGKTNGLGSVKLRDPYPYFQNDVEVASTYWDELRDALKIKFENSDSEFNFKKNGSLQLSTNLDKGFLNIAAGTEDKAPIVFSQGQLLTDLVEGALEYDGEDLYFTSGSTRKVISQVGLQGPAGPAGAPGPMGPSGGAGSSPAGSNGDIQFFSSGVFAASSNLNWNNAASYLRLSGSSSIPTSMSFVNSASVNGDLFSLGYDKRGIGIDGFALWRYQDAQWKNTFDIREDGKIFLGDYWHGWVSDVSVQSNSTDSALRVSQAGPGNLLAVKKNTGIAEQFLIDNNGFVSVHGIMPIAEFTVNGSVLIKDGTQADGFVLTSDVNGLASWQDLTSLVNGLTATSSGISGAIQFSGGSNGFSSDATNLFWNNTTKRLGLGTSNPNQLLTVNGAISFDPNSVIYLSATSPNDLSLIDAHFHADYGLWARGSGRTMGIDGDANNLSSYTAGIVRSTLNSTGLGIGKSPAYKLDVNGSVQFQGANYNLRILDAGPGGHNITSSSSGEHVRFLPSNRTYFFQEVTFNQAQGTLGDFRVFGDINTNFVFADVSTEYFGIGTASPGAKLDVNGGILGNDLEIDTGYFSEKIKISDTAAAYKGLSFIDYSGAIEFNIAANNSNTLEIRRLAPSAGAGSITWGGGNSASAGRLVAASFGTSSGGSVFFPQYTIDSTSGDESGIYGSGGAIRLSTDRTDRLTVAFNGDIGIGTTTPVRKLHISDTMRLEPRSTPPAAPALGDLYVDSDTNELCFYDGTIWTGIKAGGACI